MQEMIHANRRCDWTIGSDSEGGMSRDTNPPFGQFSEIKLIENENNCAQKGVPA